MPQPKQSAFMFILLQTPFSVKVYLHKMGKNGILQMILRNDGKGSARTGDPFPI